MATVDECRDALNRLAARMDANAASSGNQIDLDRPLACTVTDLGVAFHGQLTGGRLLGLTDGDNPDAKIRLTASSDDLVAMINGELDLAKSWASGRIGIKANPFDLLKLRKLM
ncbi:MAG TPA: SCP2 sterol-binding domain-containing protein [Micromonosporaceae bacterium]|nr:SCP2 sterol-binding domain-containing protein [Micromonosporaceae bacterium]